MKSKNIPLGDLLEPEIAVRTVGDEDKFGEMLESIKTYGLIEPLVVTPEEDKYRIIAGHRRYLALKALGYAEAPCVIAKADGYQVDMMRLHENIVREDVNAVDLANYYAHIMRKYQLTGSALAQLVGKSDAHVSQVMSLLRAPDYMKEAIASGDLAYMSAYELNKIPDEEQKRYLTEIAVKDGASYPVVREWVNDVLVREGLKEERATPEVVAPGELGHIPSANVCFACGRPPDKDPLNTVLLCIRCRVHLEEWKEEGTTPIPEVEKKQ